MNKTLGQRIAERRKMLGLSQEAFGDKMAVSRQAISKWEADAAIPEIDKLISMSRLFDVSIGWLLGTEEAPGSGSEGFSDEQIKAIEQIVRQYQSEPVSQPAPKWPVVIGAIGTALSLLLSCFALSQMDDVMNYHNSRINSLYNTINNLQSQIDLLGEKPESTGAELLMDWQIGIEAKADLSGAYITFTGTPISTQPDDQAYITIRRDGQQAINVPCTRDSSSYCATTQIPVADGYSCYFTVTHSGGNSEQQRLVHEELEHLDYALRPHAFGYASVYEYSAKDQTLQLQFEGTKDDICVSCPEYLPRNATVDWSDLELVLYRNETVMDQFPLTNCQENEYDLFISLPTTCNFSLPDFANGDQALLYVKGKLTVNDTTTDFCCRVLGWVMDDGLCEIVFIDEK